MVPYSEKSNNDYFDDSYTPIKLNDLFLLNSAWDKNNTHPYFKVSKTDFVPSGINFDDKLIGARKVGVRETAANAYLFSFDSVRRVIDGNSEAAKNFVSENHPASHPININNLFQKDCPYRLKPGLSPFSPTVQWSDYEEVSILPEASVPTARFQETPLSAPPKPSEGARAPANQEAQKAHTLDSSRKSQNPLHTTTKETQRISQKEGFRKFHEKRDKTPRKPSLSLKNSSESSKLFSRNSADKVITESFHNIINPNSSRPTTRSKIKNKSDNSKTVKR